MNHYAYREGARRSWLPAHENATLRARGIVPERLDARLDVCASAGRKGIEAWQAAISRQFTELSPDVGDPDRFGGSLETIERGNLAISHIASRPQRVNRCGTLSRGARVEEFYLNIQLEGTGAVHHAGGQTSLSLGECVIVDPNDAFVLDFASPFRQLCLQLPEGWLTAKLGVSPRSVVGVPLSIARGGGAVLGAAVRALIVSARDDPDTTALVDLFGDVLGNTMRMNIRRDSPGANDSGAQAMYRRIVQFIDGNFRDEALDPGRAARALSCSNRYIHKACASQGTTFGVLLREARISAAARALVSADNGTRISTICYDCGFSDVSHFNRTFRDKFGVSPRVFRKTH